MSIDFKLDYVEVQRSKYTVCEHASWEHGRGHKCYHKRPCHYPYKYEILSTNLGCKCLIPKNVADDALGEAQKQDLDIYRYYV